MVRSRNDSSSSDSAHSSGYSADDAPNTGSPDFYASLSISLYAPMITNSLVKPDAFLCTSALEYVLRFISLQDNWQVGMRSTRHDVLDQLVAFFFPEKCRKQMHEHASPSTFKGLIIEMCSTSIVKELDAEVTAEGDLEVALWPASSSVLFPAGAKNAVLSLLQWYRRTDTMEPLNLLVALSVISPPTTPCSVPSSTPPRSSLRSQTTSRRTSIKWKCSTVPPLQAVQPGAQGYSKYTVLRTYMQPQGQVIYGSIGVLLRTYRILMKTESRAMVLMSLYTVSLNFTTDLLPSNYEYEEDPNIFLAPASILHGTLATKSSGKNQMCGKALCPNAKTNTKVPTSLCSGCRLVLLAACQKAAWGGSRRRTRLGASANEDEFEGKLEAGGFEDTKIPELTLGISMAEHAALDRIFSEQAVARATK
ncbi:hypothetical protein B0H17DRAFT_1208870 [Mycena rosella]|uniref:Uncharacterized protein n=1 Tax=Mycena rosella TaxID=1033263 RepID=A0AAD7CZS3_MYCRO|nr:hypothetical protein B0H17DRAFT_1208870 [Mycena rosella]